MAILLASNFDDTDLAAWLDALREALPGDALIAERHQAAPDAIDIALVANPSPGALQGLPGLRLIQSLWAGVDRLLRDRSIPAEVPLARMVDPAMNDAMAETALWAVLSLHRRFVDYAAQQQQHEWRQLPQRRADDVLVAVLGLGEMGGTVARRLVLNGYRVVGWSTRPSRLASIETRHGDSALPALLAQADIVVDLLPLTPATEALFNAKTFAAMRRGAAFINLARGAHVVDDDLLTALSSGQLRHAVLDVFRNEPLPADHPYWSHPRVTLLPHVAALTDPRSAAAIVARNVAAVRAGRSPEHLVDRTRGY